jgi:hypothetical protein
VAADPYTSLDLYGVGGMMQMAVRRAKRSDHAVKVCAMSCAANSTLVT